MTEQLVLDQGGRVWGLMFTGRGQTKVGNAECNLHMIDSCSVIWDLETWWIR